MPLISLLRIADDSSIVSDMKKILFPAPLLLLCLLVAGCGKQQVKPVSTEGARLIVPVPVTDQDMLALRQVTNFMEPHRKIGVVLGYGYNDEAFVEAALQELGRTLGMAENGGAVVSYRYPEDFIRGGSPRISALTNMLEADGVAGLVVVGAPEGTHRALAALQDTDLGRSAYPVISLMPQDDILGIESGSDMVIEYVPASATADLTEESGAYQENIPQLIARAAYYITLLPSDFFGGFQLDMELLVHARQLAGASWEVSRYIDPETGLCPMNHFVIDRRQGQGVSS